jgi:hypothetical protein
MHCISIIYAFSSWRGLLREGMSSIPLPKERQVESLTPIDVLTKLFRQSQG